MMPVRRAGFTRIGWIAGWIAAMAGLMLPLGLGTPPAPSAPARSGCVACHTDRAMLEPLVPLLPPPPSEGEG
jgi:hypothetical protein